MPWLLIREKSTKVFSVNFTCVHAHLRSGVWGTTLRLVRSSLEHLHTLCTLRYSISQGPSRAGSVSQPAQPDFIWAPVPPHIPTDSRLAPIRWKDKEALVCFPECYQFYNDDSSQKANSIKMENKGPQKKHCDHSSSLTAEWHQPANEILGPETM